MISHPPAYEPAPPAPPARAPARNSVWSTVGHFLKSTILGGFLFLIPVILIFVILREAFRLVGKAVRPISRLLPRESIEGVVIADALAVLLILAVCLGLGLFVGTKYGRLAAQKVERTILRKVPGYSLLKSATHSIAGVDTSGDVSVALARIEEAWTLAFIIERHPNGMYTVFVPSAPTPAAGAIYYLTEDRLQHVNASVAAASACIMRLGVGSAKLLENTELRDEVRTNGESFVRQSLKPDHAPSDQ